VSFEEQMASKDKIYPAMFLLVKWRLLCFFVNRSIVFPGNKCNFFSDCGVSLGYSHILAGAYSVT